MKVYMNEPQGGRIVSDSGLLFAYGELKQVNKETLLMHALAKTHHLHPLKRM